MGLSVDVSAINAVEKTLNRVFVFSKRTIINASGVGVKDIQQVKDQIQRSNFDRIGAGTITLTCGRFLEGTVALNGGVFIK